MGRRLAFDQAKGRLWVICERCSRWNLSPVEERWEAIESCEKLYRDSTKRVATDEIGLAKVNDGLALVRIGRPVFPEYASWRYGERFARRRTRHKVMATAGIVGGIAVIVGGPFLAKAVLGVGGGSTYWLYQLYSGARKKIRHHRTLGTVSDPQQGRITVRGQHAESARLISGGEDQLRIQVENVMLPQDASGSPRGLYSFREDSAKQFLRFAMPYINRKGGTDSQVAEAVKTMELSSGPADPLLSAQIVLARNGHGDSTLTTIPEMLSVGLEMAVMEGQERLWLESQLHLLEATWKEAEDLAAIADNLTLPEWMAEKLGSLRGAKSPE